MGEEEASSLPIIAATGLGPTGWALSQSGPDVGLWGGKLGPSPGLVPGGGGALLFWLLATSGEGPPASCCTGLDVLGS